MLIITDTERPFTVRELIEATFTLASENPYPTRLDCSAYTDQLPANIDRLTGKLPELQGMAGYVVTQQALSAAARTKVGARVTAALDPDTNLTRYSTITSAVVNLCATWFMTHPDARQLRRSCAYSLHTSRKAA